MEIPLVGAQFDQHGANFTVWAPLKDSVELVLNHQSYPMQKDELGFWHVSKVDARHGAYYKFRIDHKEEFPDPASRWQPEGVHGPSAICETNYTWSDHSWEGLSLSDLVIYELHVGTFTPEGTFEGVQKKLPYLKELGINAIELMPIAQFPGGRNWGYDGVYPFAVQNSYGGVKGLKDLVNAAHQHGIAVILDVVYNHQGPEGNYLGVYAPYFTEKYRTGWGQAINFDDAYSDGVRYFYWQNALMWLDEFQVDGLRLDAVHAIYDNGAKHFIEELNHKVKSLKKKTGRKKLLIAEFDLNNPRYISPPEFGGYGLDGQWIDEFHHALHSVLTKEVDGYYEDFGTVDHLRKSIRDSYVYTGQYSIHRKKKFGKLPEENSYDQFVVFLQNHDQVGNRMLGDRISQKLSLQELKLAAASYILSPHIPMLFMGEEYGEKNPFQYFISHTDDQLVEAVRKGRKEEFSYFKWQGTVPDPQSEKTFSDCILSWNLEDEESVSLFNFYRELIQFRKGSSAMRNFHRSSVEVFKDTPKELIAFKKSGPDENLLILLNFSNQPEKYYASHDIVCSVMLSSYGIDAGTHLKGNSISVSAHGVLVLKYLSDK